MPKCLLIQTFWLFLFKIKKDMELSEYQNLLKSLEKFEPSDILMNEITLSDFCKFSRITEYKVVLKPVNTLTRFDFYYTSFKRYDDDTKTYRRQYNEMKSYNYPISMPSYNNGVKPLVPHIEYTVLGEVRYKRIPNEVLITLNQYWDEN